MLSDPDPTIPNKVGHISSDTEFDKGLKAADRS